MKLEDYYASSLLVALSVQYFYLRGTYNIWCCAKVLEKSSTGEITIFWDLRHDFDLIMI